MKEFIAVTIERASFTTGAFDINLPIVRIDPNSRRQHHQPIVIRGAVLALATATYLVLVVVESKWIHEYTTRLNVDTLWWNLFLFYFTLETQGFTPTAIGWDTRKKRALDTMKSSCTWTLLSYRFYCAINNFCHLKLFNLSFFLLSSAIISLSHFVNSPNGNLFVFSLFFLSLLSLASQDKLF